MKPRKILIASASAVAILSLLTTSTASAQDFEALPPVIADVVVKMTVIIDNLLGNWVSGNDLTNAGTSLVDSVGQIVISVTDFFAIIVKLF